MPYGIPGRYFCNRVLASTMKSKYLSASTDGER